jgi:ATP-dependent DNA ligase
MHPTAARELPAAQEEWAFEPKWDGYRALGHVVGGGPGRRPGRRRGATVTYLVFDLLWLDGRPLTGLPYAERRELLEELALAGPTWQTVGSFAGAGTALLAATREQGLEGVVAKRLQSRYLPGRRTRNWLKVKHYQRETFLVGGFVPDGDQVRSLLVGPPDPERPGRLRFAARVDHGLVPAARRGSGSCWDRWSPGRARSPSPRRPCWGAAGPALVPTTRPRCSSAPRSPSRSASSAGRRAACATPPTPA